jgi:hypothetical protein
LAKRLKIQGSKKIIGKTNKITKVKTAKKK